MAETTEPDLTLYDREVARLSGQLSKTWRQMSYPQTPENSTYERWGGKGNFLQILGVYMIVEKGLDLQRDELGIEDAIDEMTNRTF